MQTILRRTVYSGIFLVPFIPFLVSGAFFFPFITTKAFVFRIIVEVVFASWVLLALLDEKYRPRKSWVMCAVLAFIAVVGVANLFGAEPVKSFWSNYERMEGYITLLHLGAYFLVAGAVFSKLDWRRWWNTSLVASALMVGYALLQLAGAININQGGARVDGTFGNSSYMAVYMLFHFFVALLFFMREKRGSAWRYVYGLLALSHLFVVYHTATRGAILGVLGGLVVLALLNLRNPENAKARKTSMVTLLAIVLLVGGFFTVRNTSLVQGSPVLVRFAEISTTELQGGGRSYVWPMALQGVAERPLLGWGQENFNHIFQEHYSAEMVNIEPWFDRAHNIFLDWAVAGGILGLLAYLSLYVALLYMLWRQAEELSYTEKAVLTSLVSAYFFHNLFVFDHLISYILFFSLLAYIHGKSEGAPLFSKQVSEGAVVRVGAPVALVLLLLVLWVVNIRPIAANTSLIEALRAIQLGEYGRATSEFRDAHETRLGRPEAVEQIMTNSTAIFRSSLGEEEKLEFLAFTKSVAEGYVEALEGDARAHLSVGSFYTRIQEGERAEVLLLRAKELIPEKPAIYHALGSLYLVEDKPSDALSEFRQAYELNPDYTESKVIYLAGAIQAVDRALEAQLLGELDEREYVFDNRIAGSYAQVGRQDEAVRLVQRRMELDPQNAERHRQLLQEI